MQPSPQAHQKALAHPRPRRSHRVSHRLGNVKKAGSAPPKPKMPLKFLYQNLILLTRKGDNFDTKSIEIIAFFLLLWAFYLNSAFGVGLTRKPILVVTTFFNYL